MSKSMEIENGKWVHSRLARLCFIRAREADSRRIQSFEHTSSNDYELSLVRTEQLFNFYEKTVLQNFIIDIELILKDLSQHSFSLIYFQLYCLTW